MTNQPLKATPKQEKLSGKNERFVLLVVWCACLLITAMVWAVSPVAAQPYIIAIGSTSLISLSVGLTSKIQTKWNFVALALLLSSIVISTWGQDRLAHLSPMAGVWLIAVMETHRYLDSFCKDRWK